MNAMILLADKGTPGEVYNVSGERVYEIRDIIPFIEKAIGLKLNIQVDEKLLRPSDEPIIYGDSSRLKDATGWSQQYSLEQTIYSMFQYLVKKQQKA